MVGGDTCEAIGAAHNANSTLIHENNPQIDPQCSNIYIGEVLCVADKVTVPPPAGDKPPATPPTATLANPPPTPTSSPADPAKTPEPQRDTPKPQQVDDNDDDLPWCDEL